MTAAPFLRALGVAMACAVAVPAAAQAPAATAAPAAAYEPSVGQAGKDVVWVPTSLNLAQKMLDMAGTTAKDHVIDLGSGDGRTVITAAKRGARALGIEYNPDLVELSRRNAQREGVAERATFVKADLFESDFSQATVITMFLLPELNLKLRPRILDLKPGTRIVSNSFHMGDWEADETTRIDSTACENSWCTALLWIVPAKVAGTHQTPHGELTLEQEYQMLKGTLLTQGRSIAVRGKVIGEDVVLIAGNRALRGKANGKRIELQ